MADTPRVPIGDTVTVWLPRAVVVVGALATIVGLVVVERLGDRYRAALDITIEAAEIAASAADPVTGLPAAVAEVADTVSSSLAQVRTVALTAGAVTGDLSEAARTNLAQAVEGTSSVADRLAGFVELVERFVPGDADSLAEDLRTLSDGLEPIPGQLTDLADRLETGSESLSTTADTIELLEQELEELSVRLGDATVAVEDLPLLADRLRSEAAAARDDLDNDLWLLRLLVVLVGATAIVLGLAIEAVRRSTEEAVDRVLSASGGG